MPASVQQALSSAPLEPLILSAIFFRSMPRVKFILRLKHHTTKQQQRSTRYGQHRNAEPFAS